MLSLFKLRISRFARGSGIEDEGRLLVVEPLDIREDEVKLMDDDGSDEFAMD